MNWEVMLTSPVTPEYLKWFKVPITFDRSDHPDFIPKLGEYPLIVNPIIKDVKLNRVPIDGGSFLNILFLKTFDQMGLPGSTLQLSRAPFHGVVPGTAATPVGQIILPITFMIRENYRTKYMQFEVTYFKMAYNTFLRRSALIKFMAIPHYAYLVLKMLGLNGVISIKGDAKQAYDCDRESCKMADALHAFVELQNLKKAMAESPPDPIKLEAKTSKLFVQSEDKLNKTI
jgi:hypothetical protein